jgi:hypothetical protein
MLSPKIENYLNKGYNVAAEVPTGDPGARCFVRIRAIAKPGVPREEVRYLNSRYSMWQYWNYSFRRMVLRSGWEIDEWNYDRYLVGDERCETTTEAEFLEVLRRWVSDPASLRHVRDSECPE